jgi:succinoglycan biosynthesis protein ExoV
MDLKYCSIKGGNFGDDLNTWLWAQFFDASVFDREDNYEFFGIGTVLTGSSLSGVKDKIILGSGVGEGFENIKFDPAKADFYWVRGPKAARSLGLAPEFGLLDPAYLLLHTSMANEEAKLYRCSVIPHHMSVPMLDWKDCSQRASCHYINPKDDFAAVIRQIKQSELVVTESLHGAIIADAFNIPWIAIEYSHRFDRFKWQDWSESVEVELRFHELPFAFTGQVKSSAVLKNFLRNKIGRVTANPKWYRRPYKKSSDAEISALVDKLAELAASEDGMVSQRTVIESKVQKMLHSIERFKRKYIDVE